MKLYTEEQVRQIARQVKEYGYYDNLNVTPIELPSDEDIREASPYVPQDASMDFWANQEGFIDGAKWMKEQILNK